MTACHTCPVCTRPTPDLKRFRLPDVVFLLVGAQAQQVWHTACPGCMSRILNGWAVRNLVTANVLAPLVVLPLYLIRRRQLGHPGHSADLFARPPAALSAKALAAGLGAVVLAFGLAVAVRGLSPADPPPPPAAFAPRPDPTADEYILAAQRARFADRPGADLGGRR